MKFRRSSYLGFAFTFIAFACTEYVSAQTFAVELENPIATAFPFLLGTPDAGICGIGEAGTAVLNPGNIFTNAAAYSFEEEKTGVTLDYKRGTSNFLALSGFGKLDERQTISGGLRYGALGGTTVITPAGSYGQSNTNFELALDLSYGRKLTDNFSAAVNGKFLYSTLSRGAIINGIEIQPIATAAVDIATLYRKQLPSEKNKRYFSWGLQLANLGGRVEYGYPGYKLFLPAQISTGFSFESVMDDNSSVMLALDIQKLLVPTLSINSVGGIGAMLNSFNDAPGGLQEELHEIVFGGGIAYAYQQRIFARGGYFYEHPSKGGRTFFSLGTGFTYQQAAFNVAYRFYNNTQTIVVANALTVSLSIRL